MKPTDGGCCYPAPVLTDYKVTHYPAYATLGFISAVVRYAPPPPPPPLRSNTLNGYVFGGGEWSYPGYALDSDESKLSLEAAAATGANSIEFTPMVRGLGPALHCLTRRGFLDCERSPCNSRLLTSCHHDRPINCRCVYCTAALS
eukprot:SAG22_NODE_5626_length_982_cov_0.983012_2_plen_145_part_01